MPNFSQSPRILQIAWGEMKVEGLRSGADMKLWPGGGRDWDCRETDTHHVPGIQIADVTELIERGARAVVLTQRMYRMLKTCAETLEYLAQHGVAFHVAETTEAVRIYNELAESGSEVGGLFHSTC